MLRNGNELELEMLRQENQHLRAMLEQYRDELHIKQKQIYHLETMIDSILDKTYK